KKVCEGFSDIEGIGPDYQTLWWNPDTKQVWWVSFDGDEEEGVQEVHRRLGEVRGVREVLGESETSPKGEGWVKLRSNTKALSDSKGLEEGKPCTPGHTETRDHCIPQNPSVPPSPFKEGGSDGSFDSPGLQDAVERWKTYDTFAEIKRASAGISSSEQAKLDA